MIPSVEFGERFRIQSVSGNQYVARMIHQGDRDAGMYVRLEDRRLARLDNSRVEWSTYCKASDDGEQILQLADEVIVETAGGRVRGFLAEEVGEYVALNADIGPVRLARSTVIELHLLFRARKLRPGDRLIVRSKSGNEYQGTLVSSDEGRLSLELSGGRTIVLHIDRLDMDTLQIPVPVPLDRF